MLWSFSNRGFSHYTEFMSGIGVHMNRTAAAKNEANEKRARGRVNSLNVEKSQRATGYLIASIVRWFFSVWLGQLRTIEEVVEKEEWKH